MKNLFDTLTFNEITERMNKMSPTASAQWGKMNVAQMLCHCKEAFRVPLSEKKLPRVLLGRLIGWLVKSKLYNNEPWKKNLPTSPAFIVKDERNFHDEKKALAELVKKFYTAGPMGITKHPHPMFGKFTPEQWGQAMYKHLDHHLRQFSA